MLSELLIGKEKKQVEHIINNLINNSDFYTVLKKTKGNANILPIDYLKKELKNHSPTYQIRTIILNNLPLSLIPRDKNGICHFNGTISKTSVNENVNLPDKFNVNGSLSFSYNIIDKLPIGLVVSGDLEIDSCKLNELPNDLKVGNNLYITDNNISEIPETIEVGNVIYITKNPLKINNLPDKFKYFNWDL